MVERVFSDGAEWVRASDYDSAVHMFKAALDWMWEFLPLDDGPIGPEDGDHESQWIAAEIEAARIRSPLYSTSGKEV